LLVACASCNSRTQIALDYELVGIAPGDVVRVETVLAVDPSETREFFADQPYRSVATGVGYEVRDVDGSGKREVLITHDATLGYVFQPKWTFTLLPPEGEPPPKLVVIASAHSPDFTIGETNALPAAFGGGASVHVPIPDKRCGTTRCRDDQDCCDGKCIDPLSDPSDCGACNAKCIVNEQCQGGQCSCSGGSPCTGSRACCPMGCFDLTKDRNNCGSCGNKCNPGETCVSSACSCGGGAACMSGQFCCSGACQATSCKCGGVVCPDPTDLCCASTCTPQSNADCGACGATCTTPFACTPSLGQCTCNGKVCQPSDACCPSGCADLMSSGTDCGMCGHACAVGEQCVSGQCLCGMKACTAGQICCGSTCVDPTMDRDNCGSCGHMCRTGEVCTASGCSCAGGRACVGNETCCPSSSAGGSGGCFDLSMNAQHCGSCTNACSGGQSCVMGVCQQNGCTNGCTNGNQCVGTVCECNGNKACVDPFTCCPTVNCVNELSDPLHCGSCNNLCLAGEYCCGGGCTAPDAKNCTGCNQPCPPTMPICCVCGGGGPLGGPGGPLPPPAPYCTTQCVCPVTPTGTP
jgi:hypothetical protein